MNIHFFLGVCMFALCVGGFSPGTLSSSHSLKTGMAGGSKMPLNVRELFPLWSSQTVQIKADHESQFEVGQLFWTCTTTLAGTLSCTLGVKKNNRVSILRSANRQSWRLLAEAATSRKTDQLDQPPWPSWTLSRGAAHPNCGLVTPTLWCISSDTHHEYLIIISASKTRQTVMHFVSSDYFPSSDILNKTQLRVSRQQ